MRKLFYILVLACVLIGTAEAQELTAQLVASWGARGNGPGQFYKPQGIFVRDENVFVLDSGNLRVQVFSRQGNFLSEFPTPKRNGDMFFNSSPNGIVVDSRGLIYVTDGENKSLAKLRSDGEFIGYLLDGRLFEPADIAIDESDNLYILNGQQVVVSSTNGVIIKTWIYTGLVAPQSIAVDKDRNVWIGHLFSVNKFTNDGNLLKRWGEVGMGGGQFLSYVTLSANPVSGDVYASGGGAFGGVSDDRIQAFTPEGEFIFSWRTQNATSCALTFDETGNIFEIGCLTSQVQEFEIVQIPVPVQPTTWGHIKSLFR